ncbi:MAG: hypothetical protein IIA65_04725 [Planctomycetes bacterium]|nr:hypothetical protein [Planctomycetota bacterium]
MKSQNVIYSLLIVLSLIGLASLCSARSHHAPGPYTGDPRTFTLEIVQHYRDKYLVVMDTRSSKLKVTKFDPEKLHNSMMFSDSDFSVFTLVP